MWKTKNYDVVETKIKGCFSVQYFQEVKHEVSTCGCVGSLEYRLESKIGEKESRSGAEASFAYTTTFW